MGARMKRFLVFLLFLVLVAFPAFAQVDHDRYELYGGLDFTDIDGVGRSGSATGEFLFPLGSGINMIGPKVEFQYLDPDDGESLTGVGWGGVYHLNFWYLYAGVEGAFITGQLNQTVDGTASVILGTKITIGESGIIRIGISRTRLILAESGADDVDSTDVTIALGVGFP